MNKDNFDYITKFLKDETAIILEPGKEYLVETRLTPLVQEFRLESLDDLIKHLHFKPTPELKVKIIDAMTINETLFFRDNHPFEALKSSILPEIAGRKKDKKLNIWCAASSSGQEPYSIAMILKEHSNTFKDWTINFTASDLSEKILQRAKTGIYNQLEVNRGLPMPYLMKYFEKTGVNWQIKEEIRHMVKFKKINLKEPWNFEEMDLVFMRNVLIYFNHDTKKEIFKRLEKTLHPEGYFFLGGSETTIGVSNEFEKVGTDRIPCYRLKKKDKN